MANIKPTNLRVLEGNRSKTPIPKDEPKPQPIAPDMPAEIDLDAKKTWSRLSSIIVPLGLLTEADGDSFAALCQTRSRLKQIWTRLNKIPREIKALEKQLVLIMAEAAQDVGEKSAVVVSDIKSLERERAVTMKEERLYYAAFRKFASDFGLSPRARVGLTVQGDDSGEKGRDLLS